ncbi:ATP-binding protein [Kutzneria albida]|uniref:ATP-binding protein n=1 Tax=Kutzneria albida TaxID=43357 RepID=UPI0009DD86DF|nr:ATP-binding protein [Kutzneria albida]
MTTGADQTVPPGGDGSAPTPVADLRVHAVPAAPEWLAAVRHALGEWAVRAGLAADQVADLVQASYEAVANVIDHAYPDTAGRFDVDAVYEREEQRVTVTVTDYGRWRAPRPDARSVRGRGLLLIERLAPEFELIPEPGGTQVYLGWPCPIATGGGPSR